MLYLEAQAYFDREEFDPINGYNLLTVRDQKIRHIMLHTAKAAMKLVSRDRDRVVHEVIPDLSIYRSQVINLLEEPVKKRMATILSSDYPVTLTGKDGWTVDFDENYRSFHNDVVIATGDLATYLERKEHGEQADEDILRLAATGLGWASRGFAKLYDVDASELHWARLEENLGRPLPPEVR
jgi:hypothetical protein